MELRKTVIVKETIEADDLGLASAPVVRVAALAVIRNPFAGKKANDLAPLFDMGGELGARLMDDLVALLGAAPVSYGKAAIVGVAGEMEHGGAMTHPKLGKPARGGRWRQGADPFQCQGGGAGHAYRLAARPQGRGLVVRSLRYHDRDGARCAASRRDRAVHGGRRRRPAQPTLRRRPDHGLIGSIPKYRG